MTAVVGAGCTRGATRLLQLDLTEEAESTDCRSLAERLPRSAAARTVVEARGEARRIMASSSLRIRAAFGGFESQWKGAWRASERR